MAIQRRIGSFTLLVTLVLSACQPITRPSDMSSGATSDPTRQPAAAAPCETTPFYAPAPQPPSYPDLPAKLTLPRPDEPGERLIVTGTVYAEDCITPLAGVLLDVWQANAAGEYTYLEGQLMTDAQGHYEIDTIKPEMYGPPAHIHFRIAHPEAQPIETELLFEGDPNIEAGISEVVITALTAGEGDEGPLLRATFDIVLKRQN